MINILTPLKPLGCQGMTKAVPLGPVPKVTSSRTSIDGGQLVIHWDRPMTESCPIKDQINIIVDGASPIHPTSVSFVGGVMTMVVSPAITNGQTVTWAYDDTGLCDLHEVGKPSHEPDNQTYGVFNRVPGTPSVTADNTHITADDTTHTADQG